MLFLYNINTICNDIFDKFKNQFSFNTVYSGSIFQGENNIGLQKAKTKYALILNPDTELFPETLKNFLKVAQQNPDFAIIGPNIKENKKDDSIEEKEKLSNLVSLEVRSTNTVKGYAMFLNLSQFNVGGFFSIEPVLRIATFG